MDTDPLLEIAQQALVCDAFDFLPGLPVKLKKPSVCEYLCFHLYSNVKDLDRDNEMRKKCIGVIKYCPCTFYDKIIPKQDPLIEYTETFDSYDYTNIETRAFKTIKIRNNGLKLWMVSDVSREYEAYFKRIYTVSAQSNISSDLLDLCVRAIPNMSVDDPYPPALRDDLNYIVRNPYTWIDTPKPVFDKRVRILRGCGCTDDTDTLVINKDQFVSKLRSINCDALLGVIRDVSIMGLLPKVINTKTTLMDPIEEHHPLDIIRYSDMSGCIFQFVTYEFRDIIKKKINPYSTTHIPDEVLAIMAIRLGSHPCPTECQPVSEMINLMVGSNKCVAELLQVRV